MSERCIAKGGCCAILPRITIPIVSELKKHDAHNIGQGQDLVQYKYKYVIYQKLERICNMIVELLPYILSNETKYILDRYCFAMDLSQIFEYDYTIVC